MRISTFFYCLRQGMKNAGRNIWFTLASVATISACIFLFCLLFSVIVNVQYIVRRVESEVGITVLFEKEMDEADILSLGVMIGQKEEVKDMAYISAEEAWDSFKLEYFAGYEELAEGFADDNPLADSASYEIYLNQVADQDRFVEYLESLPGVRQVNYSNRAVEGFAMFNKVLGLLSSVIIGVLLAVSIFLISNTISVAAAFRRQESEIMRLIGATNMMIRAPFLVEGVVIGIIGAAIPLAAMYVLYTRFVVFIMEQFRILSGVVSFIPIIEIFPLMIAVALALGLGIGFFGSFFTIRKYLKV